jgi:flavin reductase
MTTTTENHELQNHEDLLTAFRDAMRHVAATVYAVTTRHEGKAYGILATAVSSLSFDPPSLLACINRTASLHAPLLAAGHFAVNVLGQDNREVAAHFTDPLQADRFAAGDWHDVAGMPVLASAQSSFVCRLADVHDFGTHSVIFGALLVAQHRQNALPLTYFDRNYLEGNR